MPVNFELVNEFHAKIALLKLAYMNEDRNYLEVSKQERSLVLQADMAIKDFKKSYKLLDDPHVLFHISVNHRRNIKNIFHFYNHDPEDLLEFRLDHIQQFAVKLSHDVISLEVKKIILEFCANIRASIKNEIIVSSDVKVDFVESDEDHEFKKMDYYELLKNS